VISSDDALKKPLPAPDADSAALWRGLREGVLLLQHCADCGHGYKVSNPMFAEPQVKVRIVTGRG